MDTEELTFDEKITLLKTFGELRSQPPIGAIGLVEFRDLIGDLFPHFAKVRDAELDGFLQGYIQELYKDPVPPVPDPGENLVS